MGQYFVDTWYLIALFNRHDGDSSAAQQIGRRFRSAAFFTHEAIFSEFLAYFSAYGRHNRDGAVHFVRELMQRWVVAPAGHDLFMASVDLYGRRLDKEYSLVDCMSMILMRERGITHVLTNDHHFGQEGFTIVSA